MMKRVDKIDWLMTVMLLIAAIGAGIEVWFGQKEFFLVLLIAVIGLVVGWLFLLEER